jgi:hypothetical protein
VPVKAAGFFFGDGDFLTGGFLTSDFTSTAAEGGASATGGKIIGVSTLYGAATSTSCGLEPNNFLMNANIAISPCDLFTPNFRSRYNYNII